MRAVAQNGGAPLPEIRTGLSAEPPITKNSPSVPSGSRIRMTPPLNISRAAVSSFV
ncbi:hypothetical protein [Streptomyces sp. TRM68416]|uniref:hypothetical protein n=1 Tax=Streptomyces sp. TRM68416 TaxID=2758412 RepID=UPI001661F3AC|nr:hypothetical protein [Streptomyces sp. TRM68416]MBD0837529.1 hypothetical protein [Streptomyces sp. TRM68416]